MRGEWIAVGGRRYRIQCGPDEASRLQVLARQVDARAGAITRQHGHIEESMLLLMACLTMADELDEARAELDRQRATADRLAAAAAERGSALLGAAAERLVRLVDRIEQAA
jgi:cell division protein ZapA